MSIYGQAKGTKLEAMMKKMAQAEANGTMMYYALARLAKEQGYDDLVPLFLEAAGQEAVHAGFYAVLGGQYPQDFWGLVKGLQKAETKGEAQVKAMADSVRAAGFAEAADEMELFAKQEGHHGVLMGEILARYPQEEKAEAPKKSMSALFAAMNMKGISTAKATTGSARSVASPGTCSGK